MPKILPHILLVYNKNLNSPSKTTPTFMIRPQDSRLGVIKTFVTKKH